MGVSVSASASECERVLYLALAVLPLSLIYNPVDPSLLPFPMTTSCLPFSFVLVSIIINHDTPAFFFTCLRIVVSVVVVVGVDGVSHLPFT